MRRISPTVIQITLALRGTPELDGVKTDIEIGPSVTHPYERPNFVSHRLTPLLEIGLRGSAQMGTVYR